MTTWLLALVVMAGPDGGTERIVLDVGETRLLDAPAVVRLMVTGNCFDAQKVPGGKLAVKGIAPGCKSTLLVYDAAGHALSWPIEVKDKPIPFDAPDETSLHVGATANLSAAGITKATTGDNKVVTVAIGEDGVIVTAVAPGKTTVRVETRDGPIVHRFQVLPSP